MIKSKKYVCHFTEIRQPYNHYLLANNWSDVFTEINKERRSDGSLTH